MSLIPRRTTIFPGLSLNVPSIPCGINVNNFFDRRAVIDALTKAEYDALTKGSLLVRRTAQKSIQQRGAARPKLKIMKANPGVAMAVLAALPSTSRRTRRALELRIREIRLRPASAPGTPPNTHVPSSHMLGFRRNLYNEYDRATHSAVVGPRRRGKEWWIPNLHEAGGSTELRQYVFIPRHPRYTRPIVKWVTPGTSMGGEWAPTGMAERKTYPARPFMRPALIRCLPALAKIFQGSFSTRSGVRTM